MDIGVICIYIYGVRSLLVVFDK